MLTNFSPALNAAVPGASQFKVDVTNNTLTDNSMNFFARSASTSTMCLRIVNNAQTIFSFREDAPSTFQLVDRDNILVNNNNSTAAYVPGIANFDSLPACP